MARRRNRVQLGIYHGAEGPTCSVFDGSRTSSLEIRDWKEHGVFPESTGNNLTERIDPRNLATPQLRDMRVVLLFGPEVLHIFWEPPKCAGKKTQRSIRIRGLRSRPPLGMWGSGG